MKEEKKPRRNARGKNLEKSIKSGRTKVFNYDEKKEANEHAVNTNTYTDDLYQGGEWIGWYCPK
jgi:hypothetical protein